MLNDLRHAVRVMRRSPLFALSVTLTIAIAIAANTAIFSVVNAVLLRPLPFESPNRLVQVAERNDKLNLPQFAVSVLNFLSWREQAHAVESMAALGFGTFTLSGTGEPEQLQGNRISPSLMRLLGLKPVAGRDFSDGDDRPNAPAVVLLGEGLWKRRFGGDEHVVGQTIVLNNTPTTIVGIAPASLALFSASDVYVPLTIDPPKEVRLNHVILVFGRLRDGASIDQAQKEMDAVSARVGQTYPEVRDWGVRLVSFFDTFVSSQLKTALLVLLAAVGLVLLIACANIANLLLARAAARQNEMAARTALGASRSRLLRQLLVESVLLSVVGGAVGLAGAAGAVRAINHALPPNTLPIPSVAIDASVLWFAAGLTILTGLLFGIAPGWRLSRVDINDVLKQTGRGESSGVRARLRNSLAGIEIALATVLLVGAGLLIQSLTNLQRAHLGFDADRMLTFQLAPPPAKYPTTTGKAQEFYRTLLESLRSVPGVRAAAVSSGIPFGAGNFNTSPFIPSPPSALQPDASAPIDWRLVSPGYFKTMGIQLLKGREFTDNDTPTAPLAVIVSQAAARTLWGDADPIGRTIHRPTQNSTLFTVVGVVGDVRSTTLNQESASLYFPVPWRTAPVMDVVVRASGTPETLTNVVRARVHELDADLALANVRTMDEWLSASAAQPRLNAVLLGAFAFIALLIAAIGIYGVLAYSVTQRTREIGLRMALGATPSAVLRLIIRQGMTVVIAGIIVGLGAGLALGRALRSLVYGVTAHDPLTFAGVAVVLAAVALAACVIPARRAAGLGPMMALRDR